MELNAEVGNLDRNCVEAYLAFVEPHYADKDAAHNFQHIKRLARRLPTMSEGVAPQPRQDVLCFLACFHGVSNKLRNDQEFVHATTEFLKHLAWTDEEISDAYTRLERHLTNPLTVEEQIVHDANYVELLGAFGIAKAFTKGGAEGQSYEETANIFEH